MTDWTIYVKTNEPDQIAMCERLREEIGDIDGVTNVDVDLAP